MIRQELIDKVFDKIGKANLNNSLKVSDDIKDEFNDFCTMLSEKSAISTLSCPEKSATIVKLISKYRMLYNSDYKYNKQMIVDNFIMELCAAMRKL